MQNSKVKIKNLLLILLALCVLFITGCAKTVTQIVSYGEEIAVEVDLRGDFDASTNRYFLVLSSDPNYKVPLPQPDIIEDAPEFIEPDMTPEIGSIEAYFTNFYSTWSGYLILDPGGYTVVPGPYAVNQTLTRETVAPLVNISSTISFRFQLERIFGANIPDQIYFDFVAVPWPNGLEKIPKDHLPSSNNAISKITGSIEEVIDQQDSQLDADLDILKCRIEIQ
jgi:hypothetical protein